MDKTQDIAKGYGIGKDDNKQQLLYARGVTALRLVHTDS